MDFSKEQEFEIVRQYILKAYGYKVISDHGFDDLLCIMDQIKGDLIQLNESLKG